MVAARHEILPRLGADLYSPDAVPGGRVRRKSAHAMRARCERYGRWLAFPVGRALTVRILFALPGLHRVHRGAEVAFESIAHEIGLAGSDDVVLMGSGKPRDDRAYRFQHVPCVPRERFERMPKLPLLRSEYMYEELTFAAGLALARPKGVDLTCKSFCSVTITIVILGRVWTSDAAEAFRVGGSGMAASASLDLDIKSVCRVAGGAGVEALDVSEATNVGLALVLEAARYFTAEECCACGEVVGVGASCSQIRDIVWTGGGSHICFAFGVNRMSTTDRTGNSHARITTLVAVHAQVHVGIATVHAGAAVEFNLSDFVASVGEQVVMAGRAQEAIC